MKLIFIGPQGSGKGTQAKIISEKIGMPHISTGDLLRNAKGDLKKKVDSVINSGKLVEDSLMLEILKEAINCPYASGGFILDGFPRNLKQAQMLDTITDIDKVIEIAISDDEAIKRLSGRWNCKKCGIAYNVVTQPKPKQKGKCDQCNLALFQRDDDKPQAIKKRLEIYHKDTKPVLEHYKDKLVKVNGEQDISKVKEDIMNGLVG